MILSEFYPDFSATGRVALITGSGRGIGLGMAQALASAGASVVIQDIDQDVAQAEADVINAAGGKALALGGDVTDLSLAEKLVAETIAHFGGLHILINNASIQLHQPFLEFSLDYLKRETDANLLMIVRLCQLAIPHMLRAGWGRIINMGSIQSLRGNPNMPLYAMSKAGMSNLSSGLAREYGKQGITINCIAPGWFDTHRNREQFKNEDDKKTKGTWLPIPRVGKPADCAGLCLLLCSPAGEYITGQTIHIDGGMSIR